jgi:hypothetical protein
MCRARPSNSAALCLAGNRERCQDQGAAICGFERVFGILKLAFSFPQTSIEEKARRPAPQIELDAMFLERE